MTYLWVSDQETLKPFHFPIFFFLFPNSFFLFPSHLSLINLFNPVFSIWSYFLKVFLLLCIVSIIDRVSFLFLLLFLILSFLCFLLEYRYQFAISVIFRYLTEPEIASWLQPEIRWCDFVSTRFLPEKNFVSLNINTSFVSASRISTIASIVNVVYDCYILNVNGIVSDYKVNWVFSHLGFFKPIRCLFAFEEKNELIIVIM